MLYTVLRTGLDAAFTFVYAPASIYMRTVSWFFSLVVYAFVSTYIGELCPETCIVTAVGRPSTPEQCLQEDDIILLSCVDMESEVANA